MLSRWQRKKIKDGATGAGEIHGGENEIF